MLGDRLKISIHAPRTGSDAVNCFKSRWTEKFQSTLPARGATVKRSMVVSLESISIHAPRTGSDAPRRVAGNRKVSFQSTLPARGATGVARQASPAQRFQSTLPARGATIAENKRKKRTAYFNPRSPHGERQVEVLCRSRRFQHFNPRSPHGERRLLFLLPHPSYEFQSTLPARGATALRINPAYNWS